MKRQDALEDPAFARGTRAFGLPAALSILVILTAIRLVALRYSTVDLFYDEAQYWAWSRNLDFGYASKPPLLAWIINIFGMVCGDGEACVRTASPLIHLLTSITVYFIALEAYNVRTAFWSAIVFALGTGLIFSARIISTDVPLILCWSVSLLAYLKLIRRPSWGWMLAMGLALGIGSLAKYATIYFILCMLFAAVLEPRALNFLRDKKCWFAFAIASGLFVPNIYWNFMNDFATWKHTGENITGSGFQILPFGPAQFAASQFAVAGPLVFATFLLVLVKARSVLRRPEDRLLFAFAAPALGLITLLSAFRSANANWAAASVVSMTVLAVAYWVRQSQTALLVGTLIIGVATQALLFVGDANAYRISFELPGAVDPYRRTLGWRSLADQVGDAAREQATVLIVADGRAEFSALTYYLRNTDFRIVDWSSNNISKDQRNVLRDRLAPGARALFVTRCPSRGRIEKSFEEVRVAGQSTADTGPNSKRYHIFFSVGEPKSLDGLGNCSRE